MFRFGDLQVENGAQVIQVFESWAHQMVPQQFEVFAKPYANLAMSILKERHPDVPVIYFANGGSSYLESQRDTQASPPCLLLGLGEREEVLVVWGGGLAVLCAFVYRMGGGGLSAVCFVSTQ